jgi:hypothetical protein
MNEEGSVALPKGLQDTIDAFKSGCNAKSKTVASEVEPNIIIRFLNDYIANEKDWDKVAAQLLTVARLAGRLAALYAEIDGKGTVEWTHARFGLRDAKIECQKGLGPDRGKHCENADLDTP